MKEFFARRVDSRPPKSCRNKLSHMLRDVTHTFRAENRVQDCAVRPVAPGSGPWTVQGPRNHEISIWHVGTTIPHAESGQDRSRTRPSRLRRSCRGRCGPALLLVQDCLYAYCISAPAGCHVTLCPTDAAHHMW